MEMIEILRAAVKQGASDVHLLIGRPRQLYVGAPRRDVPPVEQR